MKTMNAIKILSLVAVLCGLAACGAKGDLPNVELIQDMMDQPSQKPQEHDDFFADGTSARVPPEHTQPQGFKPYRFAKDIEAAIRENKNPYAGNMSDEVLLVGQNYYATNCMVCHGSHAHGDGPLTEDSKVSQGKRYPLPIPSLVSDKMRGWQDAQIYHVITMGQGTMGPYASHIPQNVRWQLVNYIRHLQQTEPAKKTAAK